LFAGASFLLHFKSATVFEPSARLLTDGKYLANIVMSQRYFHAGVKSWRSKKINQAHSSATAMVGRGIKSKSADGWLMVMLGERTRPSQDAT
jgi:hypothetical protein